MLVHTHRTLPKLPFAVAAMSFVAGAALTWAVYEASQRLRLREEAGPLSDDVVLERVKSRVAEIVSTPQAIQISVENGVVRLAGQLPPEERDELLTQLIWLPGVVRLRNALGTG